MQHVIISGLYIICWLSTKEIARVPLPLGRKMVIECVLDCVESAVLNFEQANDYLLVSNQCLYDIPSHTSVWNQNSEMLTRHSQENSQVTRSHPHERVGSGHKTSMTRAWS